MKSEHWPIQAQKVGSILEPHAHMESAYWARKAVPKSSRKRAFVLYDKRGKNAGPS